MMLIWMPGGIQFFKLQRYPSVEKVVTACLSIFSGPRVEQSFSIMNHIITSKTSSLNIKTYEAILCVKYMLLAQNTHCHQTILQIRCSVLPCRPTSLALALSDIFLT
ncbi:hypothetical protein RRG08_065447 [Elysia crispata]|uniref:HAT C-terminal dimerisation domain-containing protein n=1 Tax=Elysia crispata TaxID=231223 RepID=A0AAE0YZ94_9GAST|nr:hypothetical protein RRG08_065447 [Elysia crispata]